MTTSKPAEIVLPQDIVYKVQKIVAEERAKSNIANMRYMHHMYTIRWVAREFWCMIRYEPNHPRKINSLARYVKHCPIVNFSAKKYFLPYGWLPSSIYLRYDSKYCICKFIEVYKKPNLFQRPRTLGESPCNFVNGLIVCE
jgi:hypothetical protein